MRRLALTAVIVLLLGACGESGTGGSATSLVSTTTASGEAPTTTERTDAPLPDPGRPATDGDLVSVHYRGTLDDGTEFDSSEGRDPLQFVVGSQQVIKGFDDAVRGMKVGETTTVRILTEDAYGEPDPAAILEFPKDEAPEGLVVGDEVTFTNGGLGTVLEVGEETVTIDANHPLAGQALTFEIEMVAIDPA